MDSRRRDQSTLFLCTDIFLQVKVERKKLTKSATPKVSQVILFQGVVHKRIANPVQSSKSVPSRTGKLKKENTSTCPERGNGQRGYSPHTPACTHLLARKHSASRCIHSFVSTHAFSNSGQTQSYTSTLGACSFQRERKRRSIALCCFN